MSRTVSRVVGSLAGCLLAGFAHVAHAGSFVLAQGVTVNKTGGKNYVVEILITVALFGLALWMVCKSSRRV